MLDFSQIESLRGVQAPLYERYQGQSEPQPAGIYLTESGIVVADYSGLIGGAIPFDEYHNRTLSWGITPYLSGDKIADTVLDPKIVNLLQKVYDGHTVEWDGNNNVGRLDQTAQSAYDELESIFNGIDSDISVYLVEDWLSECYLFDYWPAGTMTLEEVVKDIESNAERENIVLDGDIEEALIEDLKWKCETLQKGLGENHLQALAAIGYSQSDINDYYEEYFPKKTLSMKI